MGTTCDITSTLKAAIPAAYTAAILYLTRSCEDYTIYIQGLYLSLPSWAPAGPDQTKPLPTNHRGLLV